jgi:hypothetical protein
VPAIVLSGNAFLVMIEELQATGRLSSLLLSISIWQVNPGDRKN